MNTLQDILENDNFNIEAKQVNNKWIFNIFDVTKSRNDLRFNFIWNRNFPVNYVDVDGKFEKLKEYDSKEVALKVGVHYYNFIKEVLMKPRFSKLV